MKQTDKTRRKARARLGIKPRKDMFGNRLIEVGELIPEMAKQMEKALMECINQNLTKRGVYWILYTADWYADGTELRDTITPFGACPPKMLNTICWKVDNVRGSLVEVWVLPKDAPAEASNVIEAAPVIDENIIRAATGMPVLYN